MLLTELLVRQSNMARYYTRYKYVVVRMKQRVGTTAPTSACIKYPRIFKEVNCYDQKYVKYIFVNQSVAYKRPREGQLHHQDYLSFFRCPLPERRQ